MLLGFVNTHGDVRRLFANGIENCAGMAVETFVGVIVTNIDDDLAGNVFQIHIRFCGHFAGHNHHAGFDHGFAGNACERILFQ